MALILTKCKRSNNKYKVQITINWVVNVYLGDWALQIWLHNMDYSVYV